MFIFTKFIPAKSSIIKCFEMLWIYYNSLLVVFNSSIKLFLLSVSKTSVVIEISFIWLNIYSLTKAFYCVVIVSFSIKTYTFIIICISIVRINFYGPRIIFNSFIKLTNFVISKPTIKQCFKMIWHYFQGLCVI